MLFFAVNFTLANIVFQQHIVAKSCGRFQCFYSINDLERLSLLVDGIFTISTPNIRPVDHFQHSPNRKADMWSYLANKKISSISFGRKPVRLHKLRFHKSCHAKQRYFRSKNSLRLNSAISTSNKSEKKVKAMAKVSLAWTISCSF